MKKSYLTFIVLFLMIFGFNSHAQQYNSDGYAQWQNKRLGRGVNIIGYDDIWHDSSKARMKDTHFTLIKEAGFSNRVDALGQHGGKNGLFSTTRRLFEGT